MSQNAPMSVFSTDAKTIADMLRAASVGAVVTYDDMSDALGRDVLTYARPAIASARKMVQQENRMVFDTVRKVGVKRLEDGDIVNLGDRARVSMRRIASHTVGKIVCVNYAGLSREQQTKHNTALSMFGVIKEMATSKSFERLESEVASAGTELSVVKACMASMGFNLPPASSAP